MGGMVNQIAIAAWRFVRAPVVAGALLGLVVWGIGLWIHGERFPAVQHKLALLLPCLVIGLVWRLIIGWAVERWLE
jgi:hypothetical protein